MRLARIAELLQPFLQGADGPQLTTDDLDRISTYIDILQRWNARINLTAIRDPEQIVTRHFGESLFAARHLFPTRGPTQSGARVATDVSPVQAEHSPAAEKANAQHLTPNVRLADVGSGAGFPGLPIKLWAPHIFLTLIEPNHKKSTFLREIGRALTLTGVNILTARAETPTTSTYDIVTLRAVEHFDAILPIAAGLVSPGGRFALLIGSAQQEPALASVPGFSWLPPEPVPLSRSRILLVGRRPLAVVS
jgi:16S rRNA (guanine527-N7)-methyltransferase